MNRHSVTRRDFLKTSAITAGAVALPYFVPASALGAGGVSPSDKIVIGYWGTGSMGSGHVRSFTGKSDVQADAQPVGPVGPRRSCYLAAKMQNDVN